MEAVPQIGVPVFRSGEMMTSDDVVTATLLVTNLSSSVGTSTPRLSLCVGTFNARTLLLKYTDKPGQNLITKIKDSA